MSITLVPVSYLFFLLLCETASTRGQTWGLMYPHAPKRLKQFDLDVSFSCEEGRLLAIVGPSGAGKTTMSRILAGPRKAG